MGSLPQNRVSDPTKNIIMLKNHLKIAWRQFVKYKTNATINVIGLSLGIAIAYIIGMYLYTEWSFDKYHAEVDRTFRVVGEMRFGDKSFMGTSSSGLLKEELENTFAEVSAAARLDVVPSIDKITYKDKEFWGAEFAAADETIFELFDFNWLAGNQSEALSAPFRAVLTQALATQYFGKDNPIGKRLFFEVNDQTYQLEVAGLIGDLPANTHLDFDALISFATYETISKYPPNWRSLNRTTYVKLTDPVLAGQLTQKVNDHISGLVKESVFYTHFLQPLWDIHLDTVGLGVRSKGDIRKLRIFSIIAILVLLIACINFVNLTTARAALRFKEIGVRKTLGAAKKQVIGQLISEAMLYACISVLFALLIVTIAIPYFNTLLDTQLNIAFWKEPAYILAAMAAMLLVGLLAGAYPAFKLSSYQAVQLRNAWTSPQNKGFNLRQLLVVGQFFVSILLIAGTLIIYQQLKYVQHTDLGFDKEQVIYIKLNDKALAAKYKLLRAEFESLPEVHVASVTGNLIGNDFGSHGFLTQEESKAEDGLMANVLCVDDYYRSVMELELQSGEWFAPDRPTDAEQGFILNESAVQFFGLENPIGQYLNRNGQKGKVLGVVRDFHYESLHEPIKPVVMYHTDIEKDFYFAHNVIALKLAAGEHTNTLINIQNKWKALAGAIPFDYTFLDDHIASLYETEFRFGWLVGIFAALAIAVACLGLLGLVAFAAQQRTKEIGIRKVLGASVAGIVALLSKDFLKLVFIALLLATPLTWFFMNNWLEQFAYHIQVQWWVFIIAGVATIAIALLTVGLQSIRAALANPVESLRNE